MSDGNAEQVTFSLNGQTVEAGKGELVIDAAERAGVHIPRFCYHPRMRPVGMCRMCIVDIDTGRGATLQPSCMIPVAQDMAVDTESEATKKAQDGVLEFLLINHPLDCPVCDKGGECPLQDNAYAYGPGESRFVEEKRHFAKPIPISDLVLLDRERCILCDRCTRFAKDVAGDPLIHFQQRGNQTEVNTFPDHPFASYFSGNTVQICPVGALTAGPYRFKARPWDLAKAESTCTTCSVGCGTSVEASRNHVLRRQGVDIDAVNWGWLCDKGRFSFEAGESEHRLTEPMLRLAKLEPTSWGQALGRAADALRLAIDVEGAPRLGVIGGARLTNESAYAWAKLAKGILGTDNVDCQLGDGLPPEVIFGMPRATIDDVCADGGVVVVLAPDLKEELPVLHLRLRDAILEHGVRVIELAPHTTSTSELAAASLRYRPGEAGLVAHALVGAAGAGQPVDGDLDAARSILAGAEHLTFVIGRPSVAEAASTIVDAVAALHAAHPTAGVLPALRRANVHGALDMGLTPGLLPGHVAVDAAGDWFTGTAGTWDVVPDHAGLDTAGILAAAADGAVDTIVLLGADPIADFPDHDLARRALERATVIAVDTHRTASVELAQIVLAAAGPDEVDGTTTNIEGRILQVAQKVTPPGTARPDWHIAAELAHRLGRELGLESVDAIWDEIERLAPSYAGITADVLKVAAGRTGVLMPLEASQLDELGTSLTLASRRHGVDVGAARASLDAAAAGSDAERMAAQMEAKAEQSDRVEEAADPPPSAPARPTRPALLTFGAPAAPTELPQVDAYGLRLVASRTLYDRGTQVAESRSLAGLAKPARIRLNPVDLARLGLGDDARVKVSSPRGTLELDAVADPAVPPGSAGMFVNHDGADPADLLDVGAPVTTIQVQTAGGKGSR